MEAAGPRSAVQVGEKFASLARTPFTEPRQEKRQDLAHCFWFADAPRVLSLRLVEVALHWLRVDYLDFRAFEERIDALDHVSICHSDCQPGSAVLGDGHVPLALEETGQPGNVNR